MSNSAHKMIIANAAIIAYVKKVGSVLHLATMAIEPLTFILVTKD